MRSTAELISTTTCVTKAATIRPVCGTAEIAFKTTVIIRSVFYGRLTVVPTFRYSCEWFFKFWISKTNGFYSLIVISWNLTPVCRLNFKNYAVKCALISDVINANLQAKDGIKMTLDVTCERETDFKSQLTLTLDEWSRAITVIDSAVPVINEENRFVVLMFYFSLLFCLSLSSLPSNFFFFLQLSFLPFSF